MDVEVGVVPGRDVEPGVDRSLPVIIERGRIETADEIRLSIERVSKGRLRALIPANTLLGEGDDLDVESVVERVPSRRYRLDDVRSDRAVDVCVRPKVEYAIADGLLGDLVDVRYDSVRFDLGEVGGGLLDRVDASCPPLIVPWETVTGRRQRYIEVDVGVDESRRNEISIGIEFGLAIVRDRQLDSGDPSVVDSDVDDGVSVRNVGVPNDSLRSVAYDRCSRVGVSVMWPALGLVLPIRNFPFDERSMAWILDYLPVVRDESPSHKRLLD